MLYSYRETAPRLLGNLSISLSLSSGMATRKAYVKLQDQETYLRERQFTKFS